MNFPCRRKLLPLMGVASSLLMVACGLEEFLPPDPAVVTFATPEQVAKQEVVPGSYIVAFKTQRRPQALLHGGSFLAEARFHHEYLDAAYLADPRLKDLRYLTTVDLRSPGEEIWQTELEPPPTLRLAWDSGRMDEALATLAQVDFHDDEGAKSLLSEWTERGEIWFAEPNYLNELYGIFGDAATEYESAGIWWHQMIKLYAAFNKIETMEKRPADGAIVSPVIAVLDSGVDYDHPSLEGRLWDNPSPGQADCGPADRYGCNTTVAEKGTLGTGDVTPFGFKAGYGCPGGPPPVASAPPERGVCKHGTHIAGIISGKIGNNIGGVCPVCKVMSIKIIGDSGKATDTAILNGLRYILRFRKKDSEAKLVRVVNASFGKYVRARAVALVVSALKKSPNEVLVVGAASNEDSMIRAYPAALNDAIAVAAVGSDGQKAYYSNFGPWVDVAAPGGDHRSGYGIDSTIPDNEYEASQGTSMAAPVVSGVAGLILAVDPSRSWNKLRESLITTSNCSELYKPGSLNHTYYYPKVAGESVPRPLLGAGILDAELAIEGKTKQWCPFSGINRVNRGCSVVGPDSSARPFSWTLLLIPLVLASLAALAQAILRRSRAS